MRENRPYGSEGGEARAFPTLSGFDLHAVFESSASRGRVNEQAGA